MDNIIRHIMAFLLIVILVGFGVLVVLQYNAYVYKRGYVAGQLDMIQPAQ